MDKPLSHLQKSRAWECYLKPPSLPSSDLFLPSPSPSFLRAFHQDPVPGLEDQGFHILVPTTLALILVALLGLLMKRVIQRRKGERLRAHGEVSCEKGPEHSDSTGTSLLPLPHQPSQGKLRSSR